MKKEDRKRKSNVIEQPKFASSEKRIRMGYNLPLDNTYIKPRFEQRPLSALKTSDKELIKIAFCGETRVLPNSLNLKAFNGLVTLASRAYQSRVNEPTKLNKYETHLIIFSNIDNITSKVFLGGFMDLARSFNDTSRFGIIHQTREALAEPGVLRDFAPDTIVDSVMLAITPHRVVTACWPMARVLMAANQIMEVLPDYGLVFRTYSFVNSSYEIKNDSDEKGII